MSSIIQSVSYQPDQSPKLLEKLSSHLGIHQVVISLTNGKEVEGIISELGQDFIAIIYPDNEMCTLIAISQIVSVDCPM